MWPLREQSGHWALFEAAEGNEMKIESCDCIASGNAAKPKQHGADPHAKNCAIYTRRGDPATSRVNSAAVRTARRRAQAAWEHARGCKTDPFQCKICGLNRAFFESLPLGILSAVLEDGAHLERLHASE